MSEAMPRPVELPTPSAEQLAEWHALIQRIRQGDRSQVVAWDQVTAARAAATYQVLVTQRSASGSATSRPRWSALLLASSRSFGWIRPKPARSFAGAALAMLGGR
jgi:hypothetical protein